MVVIRLTQLNLETPVTQEFANSLVTSAESVQTIDERIISVSAVRVTYLNLEVPVSHTVAETLTNSNQSTQEIDEIIVSSASETLDNVATSEQTILEVITGTPVVNQAGTAPSAWVGGAVRYQETLLSVSQSEQTLTERISENILTSAESTQSIDTFIQEKRILDRPQPVFVQKHPISVPSPTVKFDSGSGQVIVLDDTMIKMKKRQKEEDELVLLGII